MCGISGIYDPKGINTDELLSMSKIIRHRGPDDEGHYIHKKGLLSKECKGEDTIADLSTLPHIDNFNDQNITLGLSHRRLSIIDLSSKGHQPFVDGSNNVLVFNGEIYNYLELRKELIQKGYQFNTATDTEVVAKAYDYWGTECVQKFLGMWALCIFDPKKNILFLSRDRFGIKPLYYKENNGNLAFSSEIKSLLCVRGVDTSVSEAKIFSFLFWNEKPNTFFDDVKEIPCGHNVVFNCSSGSIKLFSYYDLKEVVNSQTISGTLNEVCEQYFELFNSSIDYHLRADVPIGACLSGGIDSSALVTQIAQKSNKSINTFTACYLEKSIDESHYARLVSNSFENIKAQYTFPSSSDFFKDMDTLIYNQDIPIGSTSIYSQWSVMKLIKQTNIKVVFDGQGADECLGGYKNFGAYYLFDLLKYGKKSSFFTQRKLLKARSFPGIDRSILNAMYQQSPNYFKNMIRNRSRLGPSILHSNFKRSSSHSTIKSEDTSFLNNSVHLIQNSLPELLRYEDRNSMAFSIESRVPFLDHRLVELSLLLPSHHKIHEGWSKYPLRKTIENRLPNDVVWRKQKLGFVAPQSKWKKERMKDINEYLMSVQLPSFIKREMLLKLCSDDLDSNAHLSEFWRIFTFLKWIEVFNVKIVE